DDPKENLSRVNFYPAAFFFPPGGAPVHHTAAPGQMTLGPPTREDGEYRLQRALGAGAGCGEQTHQRPAHQPAPARPPAVARLDAPGELFLSKFGANHIHAVPGDHRPAVRAVCAQLGIRLDEWSRS